MNVMGHAKGKGIKEKHFKNNIKHENEWAQKEAHQTNHLDLCIQTKGWHTNLYRVNDDSKTKEVKRHKMNEQNEKLKQLTLAPWNS